MMKEKLSEIMGDIKVELLGVTAVKEFSDESEDEYEWDINPEKMPTVGAKLCYSPSDIKGLMQKQTEEEVKKFIGRLMSLHHESPLEHCNFTFAIENVSRVSEVQFVRHRIASYSIKSGRYVVALDPKFFIPVRFRNDDIAFEKAYYKVKEDMEFYAEMLDHFLVKEFRTKVEELCGLVPNESCEVVILEHLRQLIIDKVIKKSEFSAIEKAIAEDCRYFLPQSLQTKMVVTMNGRSLLNFFKHRCCDRAQYEIRQVAIGMLRECKKVAPTLFKNAGASCTQMGYCPEGNMQCSRLKGKVPTLDALLNLWKNEVRK